MLLEGALQAAPNPTTPRFVLFMQMRSVRVRDPRSSSIWVRGKAP
jgi:hypothetical protein